MPTVTLPSPSNPVKRAIDRRAAKVPRKKRARYTAAAYETAPVEANWGNPSGGDADSGGWRQERRSIYGADNTNIERSVDRFFNELAQHDRGQPSYELAADVQRPRADLRGRYKEHHADALALLKQGGMIGGGAQASGTSTSTTSTVFNPKATTQVDEAGYEQAVRRQKVAQLLQRSGRGQGILFKSGLLSTAAPNVQDFTSATTALVPSTKTVRGQASRPSSSQPTGSGVQTAIAEAGKYLGVREVGSSNRSEDVDRLQQGFGMIAQPWCGIYVGTVLRKAGVKVDSRVASVAEIERMARNQEGAFAGGWHSAAHARAGDALVTRQGQHVAFVEKVDEDGTIHVIGGNQGNGEVNRRTWKPGEVYGVARPRYGTSKRARSKRR